MKNHIPLFFIYVAIFFFACDKRWKNNYEINKIEIGAWGCMHGCPAVGLIIDSTLNLEYYGGYKAKLQGYYNGKVTQGFWDTLNLKLRQINFKKLDTSFNQLPLDAESAEAVFYWGTKKRHVFILIDDNPDSASSTIRWIINSYKHLSLQKQNKGVKFETTFQYMQPPILKSPAEQVIFPPPKKSKRD